MSCNCGGCISRGLICIPRGNDTSIIFDVHDDDGDEFDISGATEIIFIVAGGEVTSGNMGPGGAVLIDKRLSDGEITIAGTGYQFSVAILAADTDGFDKQDNYYEAEVTTSTGLKKTVSSGLFISENTMIKDIP